MLQQQNEKAFPALALSSMILGSILPLCLLLYEILAWITNVYPSSSDLIGALIIGGVLAGYFLLPISPILGLIFGFVALFLRNRKRFGIVFAVIGIFLSVSGPLLVRFYPFTTANIRLM